jgi:hypothetical protein
MVLPVRVLTKIYAATTQTQDRDAEWTPLLDVVVSQCATVLRHFASKDEGAVGRGCLQKPEQVRTKKFKV